MENIKLKLKICEGNTKRIMPYFNHTIHWMLALPSSESMMIKVVPEKLAEGYTNKLIDKSVAQQLFQLNSSCGENHWWKHDLDVILSSRNSIWKCFWDEPRMQSIKWPNLECKKFSASTAIKCTLDRLEHLKRTELAQDNIPRWVIVNTKCLENLPTFPFKVSMRSSKFKNSFRTLVTNRWICWVKYRTYFPEPESGSMQLSNWIRFLNLLRSSGDSFLPDLFCATSFATSSSNEGVISVVCTSTSAAVFSLFLRCFSLCPVICTYLHGVYYFKN